MQNNYGRKTFILKQESFKLAIINSVARSLAKRKKILKIKSTFANEMLGIIQSICLWHRG